MGTRAAIIEKTSKGYRGIYLHWDGYPSHAGATLRDYYKTADDVSKLIDLGDISQINKRVAPNENETHTFEDPADDVVVAYHRDRGEDRENTAPCLEGSLKDVLNRFDHQYAYLFDDGQWFVVSDGKRITVSEALSIDNDQ